MYTYVCTCIYIYIHNIHITTFVVASSACSLLCLTEGQLMKLGRTESTAALLAFKNHQHLDSIWLAYVWIIYG